MSETHQLEGEIVEVTQVSCATRGYYVEFDATIFHNGTRIFTKPSFGRDVMFLFQKAGFNMVKYERGHNITVPNVSVVLGTKKTKRGGYKYVITAVLGIDGETWHKLEDLDRRPRKQSKPSKLKRTPEEIRLQYIDPSTRARMEKRKADEARFEHGEKLIRWHLNENPYRLIDSYDFKGNPSFNIIKVMVRGAA